MTLKELFANYGSDKASLGYGEVYEHYFAPIKENNITLLELGVWSGGSLRAWKDFFPNAKIAGVDNACSPNILGITVHLGQQGDKDFLERLAQEYNDFDIVIDDCSHFWEDQQASWEGLWKHIKPGGFYIIEDLGTSLDHTHERWHRFAESVDTLEYLALMVRELIADYQLVGSMEFIHFYPNICVMKKREKIEEKIGSVVIA